MTRKSSEPKKSPYKYCPICGRTIRACNIAEVRSGEHSDYVFIHDPVMHTYDDLKALALGIH